jgi:transcriptional regulator with XRE-family HTH domain
MMLTMKTSTAATVSPMALTAAMRMGEAVAHARKRRGMTQDSLAKQAGLSKPTIQRLEQGLAQISVGRLFDLLDVLDPQTLQNVVSALETDEVGQAIQDQRLPERVLGSQHDF